MLRLVQRRLGACVQPAASRALYSPSSVLRSWPRPSVVGSPVCLARRQLSLSTVQHHYMNAYVKQKQQISAEKSKPLPEDADPSKMVYACRRNIKTSPHKLNLVARQIRGLSVNEAIKQLEFSPKKVASSISQVLRSAKINAKVHNRIEDNDNLYVYESFVGKGQFGTGIRKGNRGRFFKSDRPHSHYYVKLKYGSPPKKHSKNHQDSLLLHTSRVLERLRKTPPKIRNSLEL